MLNVDSFKADLINLESLQIVRKYIFNGSCSVLDDSSYYNLRESICCHFGINFNDILLVGSGKLGFSIKPAKRYMCFGDSSDIDIAIVSSQLFEKVWQDSYIYKRDGGDWPKQDAFFRYLAQGWIRPDKLPSSLNFNFSNTWWHFFEDLTRSKKYGDYKIRAGLYHSWFFLQEYQKICVDQ